MEMNKKKEFHNDLMELVKAFNDEITELDRKAEQQE
jgi:hypothetical protein